MRLLPSTCITRLPRYYGPLRHPIVPGLSLTGVRLIILSPHHGASRCARFPCVHAVATTPAQRLAACSAHFTRRISLPRIGGQVDLCNILFEACSAFTRVTACTLAGSSKMTRYIRGSSHFVTSMTAPIASGRSTIAGRDSHPLENAAYARRTPTIAADKERLYRNYVRFPEVQIGILYR